MGSLYEHRLCPYTSTPKMEQFGMSSPSPAGGENIVRASLRQIQNDVDAHIAPTFDPISDIHAIGVGVGDVIKKIFLDGLAIPYHFAVGDKFVVKRADHPFASIGQGAKNTFQSLGDGKLASTAVNTFTTVTDAPVEDVARFGGMFQHTLEQVEGKGI